MRQAGRRHLERQIGGLVTVVARQPGWVHVATYADHGTAPAGVRPGLARLLAEAPGRVDTVVDDYARLSAGPERWAACWRIWALSGFARKCCARRRPGASKGRGQSGARRPGQRSRPLTDRAGWFSVSCERPRARRRRGTGAAASAPAAPVAARRSSIRRIEDSPNMSAIAIPLSRRPRVRYRP